MAQPLSPIQGLTTTRVVVQPEAPPEKMHGGPANEFHGNVGERAEPYPWEEFAGPHFPHEPADAAMLGDPPENLTFAAGTMVQDPSSDRTPYGKGLHAGPITKGSPAADRDPDGTAQYLMQSWEAHGVRTNAAAAGRQGAYVQEDQWNGFWNTVPGDDLVPQITGVVSNQAAGFGVNDHTSNAYAKRNSYGIHASHRMRRYATGSIPGNYLWLTAAGRPLHKYLPGTLQPPIGEGPFQGDDPMYTYGIQGAILQQPATEYVAPPQPYVQPTTQGMELPQEIDLW